MASIKLDNFLIRTHEQYLEITQSTRGDVVDMDLFELWDYLEEHYKLPLPILTTHLKCYAVTPEAQLQFSKTAKNYYSAIAVVDENNMSPDAEEEDIFLEDVEIKTFNSKENAIDWIKQFVTL